jgi:hypothetical protein
MKLTDTAIRNARPGDRPRKLFDGDGLYLYLSTTGHRAWRFKYYIDGKEKHLHFGRYPEISLKAARVRRLEARRALETGNDPGVIFQAERAARSASTNTTSHQRIDCHSVHRGTTAAAWLSCPHKIFNNIWALMALLLWTHIGEGNCC